MDKKGVRIISLEASEIYDQIVLNGEKVGYKLPETQFDLLCLFKNILDYSLDAEELEKAYQKIRRKKFDFYDSRQNTYTFAVVNLKFNFIYKKSLPYIELKELREYFYENGFNMGGVHYVRYKRSSGSSREGKCLFIDEKLYKHMAEWGECGLKNTGDTASWESYKSLSLSSIKGTVAIPFDGILFIKDCKSRFFDDVINVKEKDGEIFTSQEHAEIEGDIWDGESLLDESVFTGDFADKHMLLLRNKFFKSCAFNTRLQKWFKDKNITLSDLKSRGFITFATDISQIVMVTTPDSMKFLKFMEGGLTAENVKRWTEHTGDLFGVVKYDKRTKFFGGKSVQTSYQFINTLKMEKDDAGALLNPSREYLSLLRRDYDFMRYHFSDAVRRETDGEENDISDGLAERSDVIFKLMKISYDFGRTRLYNNFRNDVIESLKTRLKEGHILLSGTNATLFGNGPEMLLALSGEFDIDAPPEKSGVLSSGEIACKRFSDGEKLVCARSPHITMGNIYFAKNNLQSGMWDYFDLGGNIVCVNAIGENIQQRLNGCDYDSDTMLITDDAFIIAVAESQKDAFKVPCCAIKSQIKRDRPLAELDHLTSQNKIGQIVNLSQKLNSYLWDRINGGNCTKEEIDSIYGDICVLAVLSGIEIDKAKRTFPNISVGSVINSLSGKYKTDKPTFFKALDEKDEKDKKGKKRGKGEKDKKPNTESVVKYSFYDTAMEYIYETACGMDFRGERVGKRDYINIIDLITKPEVAETSTDYKKRDKIICICEEYKRKLKVLYMSLRVADEDEREIIYSEIQDLKAERNQKVDSLLTSGYVLYLVLKHYDKGEGENWHVYSPVLQSELFSAMLKNSAKKMNTVVQSEDGEYDLYGMKFTKMP